MAQTVNSENLIETAQQARDRETLLIFSKLQAQADDLFALYQISQFLNKAQELDELCGDCLRELERITEADLACLYLVNSQNNQLQPQVWHGLPTSPSAQAESATARVWFQQYVPPSYQILELPLLAEERLIGLVLLGHNSVAPRESQFLNTVTKEMGTAIQAMIARQTLWAKEQNLEAIVNGTTDAIIQVDLDQHIRDFNPAAEQLTSYSATEVLGQPCSQILSCTIDSGCGGSCIFAKVIKSGEPLPYLEMKLATKYGPRTVAASVAALVEENRKIPHTQAAAVAILRDVTRQKQIEQMKSDFTAMVSHELRTPLALLRGYSDTLQHLKLSAQEQELCVMGIADTTNRLEHLVEQILDVSQIEAGRLVLNYTSVDLTKLIQHNVNSLPYSEQRERIKLELAPNLPLIQADSLRLEQVLSNLLDNALKYSPSPSPITVQAAEVSGQIELQIQDAGMGVPDGELSLLFNKFQRASNARHQQLPGTGLGLFICRNIIEAHGGRISFSSDAGKGSCVKVYLPIYNK